MKRPLISIIIPVYNVEKYLDKCIESCVNQTLDEVEVIIINDASTDNSEEIILQYEKTYKSITYVKLSENIGLGAVRNRGIKIARGEYLCFVDGDDYIDKDLCKVMQEMINRSSPDLIYFDYYSVKQGKKEYMQTISNELVKNVWYTENTSACFQIIKQSLIFEHNLWFPEGILYEDAAIVPIWRFYAENKVKVDNALYYYVQRSNSIMNTFQLEIYEQLLDATMFKYNLCQHLKSIGNQEERNLLLFFDLYYTLERILKTYNSFNKIDICRLREKIDIVDIDFGNTKLVNYYFTVTERELVEDFLLYKGKEMIQKFGSFSEYMDKKIKEGYSSSIEEDIYSIINNLQSKYGRRIGIWGIGNKALPMISTLNRLGIEYELFDNNLYGKQIQNHIVQNIEGLSEKVDFILVMSMVHYKDIKNSIQINYPHIPIFDYFALLRKRAYETLQQLDNLI